MPDTGYAPSEWGTLYHNLPYDEVLGAGSAGPGKTWVLLADPYPQIAIEHERCANPKHPFPMDWGHSRGYALHLRRTLPMLKQSIMRTQREFPRLDPGVKWHEEDHEWVFSSGYRFKFGHCKDAGSWDMYMGSEYTHIGFDELIMFDEEQYNQINTRLRTDDPVLEKMLRIRAMSNPAMERESQDTFAVKDPFWVRRYFVDPAPLGKTVLEFEFDLPDGTKDVRTRMYLPATINDNPNKRFVAQYIKNLASKPRHIREALLSGNWYYTVGAYYGEEWIERIHTCQPFRVPLDWPVFRSMDWGYKHFGCIHWWTMDDDGNLFCIRELTFLGKRPKEVARMVREIEEQMGLWKDGHSAITGPADTQLWQDLGSSGPTMAAEFFKAGIPWVKADKGHSQQRNAELLLGRLKDHQDESTIPGIVFFRTCHRVIRSIPMILADKTKPWLPDDKGDSHWHDSVLYACAYANRGRAMLGKPRRAKEKWELDDERDVVSSAQRGYDGYGTTR